MKVWIKMAMCTTNCQLQRDAGTREFRYSAVRYDGANPVRRLYVPEI